MRELKNTEIEKDLRKILRMIKKNQISEAWKILCSYKTDEVLAADERTREMWLSVRQSIVKKMIGELKH